VMVDKRSFHSCEKGCLGEVPNMPEQASMPTQENNRTLQQEKRVLQQWQVASFRAWWSS
jgi:hypothetical protein